MNKGYIEKYNLKMIPAGLIKAPCYFTAAQQSS